MPMRFILALLCFAAPGFFAGANAAKLSSADMAWINTCVDQRKASKETPAKLRAYCTCMQEIVDDNEPFETITELERTYPPAHQSCWRQPGRNGR